MGRGRAYDQEIFRPSVIDFSYRDVKNAMIWVVEPITTDIRKFLEKRGYIKDKTYFDFYEAIYGSDIDWGETEDIDIFHKRKSGRRDIQFLEWLEWKYGCNFVTRIPHDCLENAKEHGEGYGCTTQKEIFPILDRCHCIPQTGDAVFDFGCGKGGALVSFLDYGFLHVGGIEYEPKIYDVLKCNMHQLELENRAELLYGDAAKLTEQLDDYNWFYFYNPFDEVILKKCVDNMVQSYYRNKRKIHIVFFSPRDYSCIENTGVFRMCNQFTVDMRQRVVGIFESYEQ